MDKLQSDCNTSFQQCIDLRWREVDYYHSLNSKISKTLFRSMVLTLDLDILDFDCRLNPCQAHVATTWTANLAVRARRKPRARGPVLKPSASGSATVNNDIDDALGNAA